MWSEILPKVKEKFRTLREQGWEDFVDADPKHLETVVQLYERITWEMVEGLNSLFLQLVQNQNYIGKHLPAIDTRIYQQAHGTIVEKASESLAEEVTTIPQFYLHVREAIDQLHGYCKLLKQDIRAHYQRYEWLEHDRKFRQINLTLRETLDGFQRLDSRNALLLKVIGESQAASSLALLEGDAEDLREIVDDDLFSEEERALLQKLLEDGE